MRTCAGNIESRWRYTRVPLSTVLAAFGRMTFERHNRLRQGVDFDPITRSDLFFVTLEKAEGHYSPSTMYRDYAIAPDLFHWESQSTTSVQSPTGQRYCGINYRAPTYSCSCGIESTKSGGPLHTPSLVLRITCRTSAAVRSRSHGACESLCPMISSERQMSRRGEIAAAYVCGVIESQAHVSRHETSARSRRPCCLN